jgi:molecular chaperone GrpE
LKGANVTNQSDERKMDDTTNTHDGATAPDDQAVARTQLAPNPDGEAAAAEQPAGDQDAPATGEVPEEGTLPDEARGDAEPAREDDDAEPAADDLPGLVVEDAAVVEPEQAPAGAAARPVEEALAEVRATAEAYLDDLRRLQAEFDNYRKRMLREQTQRMAAASQALVTRLLPVLDNLELAVSHAEQSRDFDRMLKGVEMIFGELREVLRAEGLVPIEAAGKPFDPERHEAVVAVEQDDAEPGTVVDVVRTGYELQGKVLRPAMVKVAK